MPPLPDLVKNVEYNKYYVQTIFGKGEITKFRDDNMLEIELFWKLGNKKPAKLIVKKEDVTHIHDPLNDDDEILDEITPLSYSSSCDSLEYSDSSNESSIESELFPISKVTQQFSLANLYFLGGLHLMLFYMICINLLQHLIC